MPSVILLLGKHCDLCTVPKPENMTLKVDSEKLYHMEAIHLVRNSHPDSWTKKSDGLFLLMFPARGEIMQCFLKAKTAPLTVTRAMSS